MMRVYIRLGIGLSFLLALAGGILGASAEPPPAKAWPDRTHLPVQPYQQATKIGPTLKESVKPEWPKEIAAPKGAPNVLVVLLDDVGFGATSTFGGMVPTPTLDALAANGLRYNRFHTTALCSPSRAALITGRNHHTDATGIIMEFSTPFPGYNSLMSTANGSIGKILTSNGYGTAWLGKNHNVPDWQTTPSGPYGLWPTGLGFEYFYGFIGADAHQYRPAVYENTTPLDPYVGKKDYHFDADIADHAISWIRTAKAVNPSKPFFAYYTPGATHAPHHAPKAWADKFKGKFDMGWDKLRPMIFEQQKAKGIIPPDTVMAPTPADYTRWDSLTPEMKQVVAREMEVYAGFLAYTDHNAGRVIQAIKDLGELDNTLVIYIAGDNGASAEDPSGHGLTSEISGLVNNIPDDPKYMHSHIGDFGGPWMSNHYSHGWAHAMNTPFPWDKKVASHLGGTRTGMVVSWPGHIKDVGQVRSQFVHITDIVPTILEAAQIPQPETIDGIKQNPMAGTSLLYTLNDAKAPERHKVQYFEIVANRAIYKDGWMANTTPKRLPWVGMGPTSPDPVHEYKWELYDLSKDFAQARDLAKDNPAKVKELQDLFMAEAKKYQVLPLDDSYIERVRPENRPQHNVGRTSYTYFPGTKRITEGMAPNMKNTSYSITADVEIPAGGANGVILTQGGYFGGTVLMLLQGKPTFSYTVSLYPQHKWKVQSPSKLTPGKHTIVMNFEYAGGGVGKAADVTLMVDGKQVAKGNIPQTIPTRFSADETLDVGEDTGTPVSHDYDVPFAFTGTIGKVVVDVKGK
jgi:arylsulfatase